MNRSKIERLIVAVSDPNVEYVHVSEQSEPSYGIVSGTFATGQAQDPYRGRLLWSLVNNPIGTFATGQRDPKKRIQVIR